MTVAGRPSEGHAGVMSDVRTVAFVVYPEIDPLDLIGPLEALNYLANFGSEWAVVTVGEKIEAMATEGPLLLTPTHTFDQVPTPEVVIVPGASTPAFRAMTDDTLLNYLRNAATHARFIGSVCSGSLILGAAGLLKGRKATTHWTAFDLLAGFGATPVRKRWVHDGSLITAAGQSAGIDMGLYLVEQLAGRDAAQLTQFGLEYDPEPHLGRLDWDKAPYEVFDPMVKAWVEDGLVKNPELAARLLDRLRAGIDDRKRTAATKT
jgi:transcriptional regulator GlxA family with amidase domain